MVGIDRKRTAYLQGMLQFHIAVIAMASYILLPVSAQAQSILHYSETSGFDHQTRAASLAMFQDIAAQQGFTVVDDTNGSTFSDPVLLQQFSVVVFSNTSGDALLDPVQRANFEAYIQNGGSVLGIHAASDTYRHSTANGNNTGTWDFYAELIGASVQENPNHVNGTPAYAMQHVGVHASTQQLPDPWVKNEEYYYWENGYYRMDNTAVLLVEETVGPNNQVNSYDAARPMSWYRQLSQGGRVFYTALGHAVSNFTSDTLFRNHVQDALLWTIGTAVNVAEDEEGTAIALRPLGAGRFLVTADPGRYTWSVCDGLGRLVDVGTIICGTEPEMITMRDVSPGVHLITIRNGPRGYVKRFLLQ